MLDDMTKNSIEEAKKDGLDLDGETIQDYLLAKLIGGLVNRQS